MKERREFLVKIGAAAMVAAFFAGFVSGKAILLSQSQPGAANPSPGLHTAERTRLRPSG